jgi:tRNA/tmRNA/rRNA uracil-C5-methylase (TrmA/RlmC/RlmD family)
MIIDPPRGGLSKKLRHWIIEHGPGKVLSISCDWGTLSRDLSELLKVYRFSGPFHLLNVNPGTFRMETLVFLERQPTIGH